MAKKINKEKFKKEVKRLVAEVAEVSEDKIKENSRFAEDLGIDSMKALEIVATLEKRYRITIPEEEIPKVRTLQNVYDIMEKRLN